MRQKILYIISIFLLILALGQASYIVKKDYPSLTVSLLKKSKKTNISVSSSHFSSSISADENINDEEDMLDEHAFSDALVFSSITLVGLGIFRYLFKKITYNRADTILLSIPIFILLQVFRI